MNRWTPIAGQIVKRLRPMQSMEQAAIESVEGHQAESSPTKPVLFLEDEDRSLVTATCGERSVAEEWRHADGYYAHHAATVRNVFYDVLATPSGFFAGWNPFARYGPTLARRDGNGYVVDIDRVLHLVDRSHERLERGVVPTSA